MLLDSYTFPIIFELILAISAAVLTSGCALFYLRRVRLERPAIGTFNHRDIRILFCFIVFLPFVYVLLPRWGLTAFLILTFSGALAIGYRPVLNRASLWLGIGLLIGANIWVSRTMLGTIFCVAASIGGLNSSSRPFGTIEIRLLLPKIHVTP